MNNKFWVNDKFWVYYDYKNDEIFINDFEPVNMRIIWPEVMEYTLYLGLL